MRATQINGKSSPEFNKNISFAYSRHGTVAFTDDDPRLWAVGIICTHGHRRPCGDIAITDAGCHARTGVGGAVTGANSHANASRDFGAGHSRCGGSRGVGSRGVGSRRVSSCGSHSYSVGSRAGGISGGDGCGGSSCDGSNAICGHDTLEIMFSNAVTSTTKNAVPCLISLWFVTTNYALRVGHHWLRSVTPVLPVGPDNPIHKVPHSGTACVHVSMFEQQRVRARRTWKRQCRASVSTRSQSGEQCGMTESMRMQMTASVESEANMMHRNDNWGHISIDGLKVPKQAAALSCFSAYSKGVCSCITKTISVLQI